MNCPPALAARAPAGAQSALRRQISATRAAVLIGRANLLPERCWREAQLDRAHARRRNACAVRLCAMAETPNVRLRLWSVPGSIAVVQQALSGVATALSLDALEHDDLNTVVTEVCKNVVFHAYEGQEGPLEVEVYALAGALEVVVRDRGIGIRPHVGERTQPHTGLGMPIVHALTQRLAFSKLAGGGTEVRMQFTTPDVAAPESLEADELESGSASAVTGEHTIALAPSSLARAVLPGIVSALAKQALFSADAIADIGLFADALALSARDSGGERQLDLTVAVAPERLDLRVGPLALGRAASMFDVVVNAGGRRLLATRLPETRELASRDAGEMLALRLLERR